MPAVFLTKPLTQAIRLTLAVGMATTSAPLLAQDAEPASLEALVVSATALKVETPLVETPRPASVVEEEELRERNVQSLDEAFQYRAGVVSGHYGDECCRLDIAQQQALLGGFTDPWSGRLCPPQACTGGVR